jgi:serine O-acetyltransferase
LINIDPATLWQTIRAEAEHEAQARPALQRYFDARVLRHETFGEAFATLLAADLMRSDATLPDMAAEFSGVIKQSGSDTSAAADVHKIASSNPACPNALTAFLSFRGIHAIQSHRIAYVHWLAGEKTFAVLLQNWCAKSYNVDIHPESVKACLSITRWAL